MDILLLFSERLAEQMNERNIKPNDMSNALNFDLSNVYTWLRGEVGPSLSSLIKLSDYLECSIDFLAGRNEDNVKPKVISENSFSQILTQLIAKKEISQYKISTEAKIPRSALHYWLSGKTEPLLDNLIKLADYFDVSIDYLLGRER